MGHLVRLQEAHPDKLTVIGVTEAPLDETLAFREEHSVPYYLLANAQADREAFGIDLVWGNQVYLIDPDGNVVAEGPSDVDEFLKEHLS